MNAELNTYMEKLLPDNPALPVRCWQTKGRINSKTRFSHWHEMMEIVYTKKGNAIQQISQTFYSVSSGKLSIICPNQLHSYVVTSSQMECDLIVLQFDVGFVLKCVQGSDSFKKDWLSGMLFFAEPMEVTPQVDYLMEKILNEMHDRREGYIYTVTGALLELLVLFYRASPVRLTASDLNTKMHQYNILLSDTFQLINEHYQEEGLSVCHAADNANLSISHFCRIFKRITGMGFHEYLLRYRLVCAEQLFSTNQTLCEIALSCGFGSLSSFSRAFQRWRGCSPGRARKQWKML